MLKLFRIEIEDWLYTTAVPHFVLAEDLPQAWALLTKTQEGDPWPLEPRDDGQYQTRRGAMTRSVKISEIDMEKPAVLR